jgi:hypothetical protein
LQFDRPTSVVDGGGNFLAIPHNAPIAHQSFDVTVIKLGDRLHLKLSKRRPKVVPFPQNC